MKRVLQTVLTVATVSLLGLGLMASTAAAVSCAGKAASSNPLCMAKSGSDKVGGSTKGNDTSLTSRIHNIINLLIYVIGAVAVIMIVIGGVKYTTSAGDQSNTTSAKNTIMYAVIGLVVAVLAYAIVGFVISQL